jgi:hypothetical protein
MIKQYSTTSLVSYHAGFVCTLLQDRILLESECFIASNCKYAMLLAYFSSFKSNNSKEQLHEDIHVFLSAFWGIFVKYLSERKVVRTRVKAKMKRNTVPPWIV